MDNFEWAGGTINMVLVYSKQLPPAPYTEERGEWYRYFLRGNNQFNPSTLAKGRIYNMNGNNACLQGGDLNSTRSKSSRSGGEIAVPIDGDRLAFYPSRWIWAPTRRTGRLFR